MLQFLKIETDIATGNPLIFYDKELLIFDLDGTLVDSAPDLANAINQMLSALGRDTFEQSLIRSWVGNGAQVLVERALSGESNINPSLDREQAAHALALFLELYRENLCIDTVLYPQVAMTLQQLKNRGFRLAIVTNKPFEFVQPILDHLGIGELFESILGGDSLALKKPDPLPLNHMCKELKVAQNNSLMIGDSKNDIVAAKNAKMQSVGLTYGYNYGQDISLYQPELVLSNFGDILEHLTNTNIQART